MTRAKRVLAAGAVALASFNVLTGCTGSPRHDAASAPHYPSIDDSMRNGVPLPGNVDGTDGRGTVLVRLDASAGQAKPQLHGSAFRFDYGLFDTSGKQIEWATPSPVADASDVYLTTAGLFVERRGVPGDLSRVDPHTGAVLWTFNESRGPQLTVPGSDWYDYDSTWNDSGSGGDIVVLYHYSSDDTAHTEHQELTVLDAQTGQTRFSIPSENPSGSSQTTHNVKVLSFAPLITATKNGSSYSAVESRDPLSGNVIAGLDPSWFPVTAAVLSTGNAFLTATANSATTTKVIARDARGKELWTRVVNEAEARVVAADAGHVLVQGADFDSTVFAFDAATGEPEGAYATLGRSTVSALNTTLVAPDMMTVWSHPGEDYLVPVPGAKK